MVDTDTLNLIQEQNLSYLLLAQKLLQEDKQMGMFRLHFDESMANFILSLATGQLLELSSSGQLITQFSIKNHEQVMRVLSNDRSKGLRQMHTSLMLAQVEDEKGPANVGQ